MGQFYNNEKDHHPHHRRNWSLPKLPIPWVKCEKVLIGLLCLGTILTYINLHALLSSLDNDRRIRADDHEQQQQQPKKTFVIHGKNVDSGYLRHVFETFEAVGYTRRNASTSDEWDVLWSHDYPFRTLNDEMKNLKPGQLVNHFPGSGYVTNKMNLATSEFGFVPKAFQLPKEKERLIHYANKNPATLFVQKSNNHRGIKIEKIDNLDLTKAGSFIQEYVSNPLLIDGHKFDIGIYVVLTSLEPLRLYKFESDVLFRFCPTQYHPFDPEILDKYVVGDDYLPLWKVDSLKNAFKQGFSMREAFDDFIRTKKGKNPSRIWSQVDTAIRTIYLTKESLMIESWKNFHKVRNFFELVRFDFVIDDDLHVYLMEVNMSPNLSSAHFPPNRLLYEQVLFGTFSLVGIASHMTKGTRVAHNRFVHSKQISVNYTLCSSSACTHCAGQCQICPSCMDEEAVDILKEAYLEHTNRAHFKRIFPAIGLDVSGLTASNQWMSAWFEAKCKEDSTWCN